MRVLVVRDVEVAHLGTRRATVGLVSGSAAIDDDDAKILSLPLLVMGGSAVSALGLANSTFPWIDGIGAAEVLPTAPDLDNPMVLSGVRRGYVPLYERPAKVFAGSPCGTSVRILARPSFMAVERAAEAVLFMHRAGDSLCDQRSRRAPAARVVFGLAHEAWDSHEHSRASVQSTILTASILLSLGAANQEIHERVLRLLNGVAERMAESEETDLEWREYASARQTLARISQSHNPTSVPVPGTLQCASGAPSSASGHVHQHTGIDSIPSLGPELDSGPSTTVVLHTCEAYAGFWPGWAHFFARSWNASLRWPLVFAHEQRASPSAAETIAALQACGISSRLAPTGFDDFSTRLRAALLAVATPIVFYLQEDVWLLPGASETMGSVLSCAEGLLLSRRFDGIRFESAASVRAGLYHLETVDDGSGARSLECGGHAVFRFAARHNRWLYSHQPGLWRRDALIGARSAERNDAVMQDGENPWLNELRGSRRAQKLGLVVGLVLVEWYRAVSSGGTLNAHGTAMLATGATGSASAVL